MWNLKILASSPVTRIVLSAMHTALGVLENWKKNLLKNVPAGENKTILFLVRTTTKIPKNAISTAD